MKVNKNIFWRLIITNKANNLKTKTEYYPQLDSLRGLAAISVVLWHYWQLYYGDFSLIYRPYLFFMYGAGAVILFFVLSGFVLTNSYNSNNGYLDYLFRRVFRIYPAYYIALLISVLGLYFLRPVRILWLPDAFKLWQSAVIDKNSVFRAVVLIYPKFFNIFLTPSWSLTVEMLVSIYFPLLLYCSKGTEEKIAGAYARQLPHENADIFARHLRKYNYGDASYVRKYNDRFISGMRCIFSSDSFSAYKVNALKDVGGFPDHLIMGEDVYLIAKFLHNGYKVAYAADVICKHSHNYSLKEVFQRYFDIGVFHKSESWILEAFGTANKDGIKYLLSELKYVAIRRPWLLPMSLILTFIKYCGYKLGRNYDEIGVRLCRKFSKNKTFWWQ